MKKIFGKIKAFFKNDTVIRVLKTFGQAFIGYIITINIPDIQNMGDVKAIIMAGVVAGVCAVWNLIKWYIEKWLSKIRQNTKLKNYLK